MAENSNFGTTGSSRWDSNAYGYNVNELANFFERIDYVIYHGNKAVQYSLINPVLTRFRTGDIDYSSSDVMEFDMTFEYESFTIYEQVNFGLSEFDIARFENATGFTGPAFVPIGTPVLLQERTLETLSGNGSRGESEYFRTFQPQPSDAINPSSAGTVTPTDTQGDNPTSAPAQPPTSGTPAAAAAAAAEAAAAEAAASPGDDIVVEAARETPLPSVYGDRANFATPTGKEKSFIGGLLGDIADNALSAAIHGTSIKNAVINTAVGGAVQGITNVVRVPTRPAKTQPNTAQETGSRSTAESQYVPPSDDG
jgi:hypothetical protein